VSADLRRLDVDALTRLGVARVAVVGLVAPGDEAAERRLRQLGVSHVLPHDASTEAISSAVHAAVGSLSTDARDCIDDLDWADPTVPAASHPKQGLAPIAAAPVFGAGKVVAVWGPVGSPGRSTIAVNLAAELAGLGHPTVIVDADSYGGVIAQLLGVLDEAPGLAAACRQANAGALDLPRLIGIALEVRPGLRLLSGITRADRWLELRPAAIESVLGFARSLAAFTIVDCGFCLEQDEELAYDTASPRRNGATLAALAVAEDLVGVAAADPVGLARYIRAVPDCVAAGSGETPLTVVNRLRGTVLGKGDARRQVRAALDRYAGISELHVVPEDRAGLDHALAAGRTLAEAAPKSPARLAIRDLALHVAGKAPRSRGRRSSQKQKR
jgi:Flp pilus assembly CpaE family ATPase